MAHWPLGSFLISSCFNAHSAAAILADVSADAPASATVPGAAEGAFGADAGAGGEALVLAGDLTAPLSWVLLLFLQPLSKRSGRKLQISLGWIFIGSSRSAMSRPNEA